MVQRIRSIDEGQPLKEFSAPHWDRSILLAPVPALPGMSVFACRVNGRPQATAYWIGSLPDFFSAYFVVEPLALIGLYGRQAVRAWTDKNYRKRGLFQLLMRLASRENPLISDRDGMTDDAHSAWMANQEYLHRYYDQHRNRLVDVDFVPAEERFTESPAGRRWLLVSSLLTEFLNIDDAPVGSGVYEIHGRNGMALKVGIASNLRRRLQNHRASRDSGLRLKAGGSWNNPDDVESHSSILAKHLYYDSTITTAYDLKNGSRSQIVSCGPMSRSNSMHPHS